MENNVLEEFKNNSIYRLKEGERMLHLAFKKIDEEQLWLRAVPQGMSLGNQLLHSCGNMTQYIIASLGNRKDNRQRTAEFETQGGATSSELLKKLTTTVALAVETIETTTEEEYLRMRKVQGFNLTGIGAVLHAVEHFSYHVGQVAFWVKQLTNSDLGFYDQQDLNQLNP